jgi:hypothetical protein
MSFSEGQIVQHAARGKELDISRKTWLSEADDPQGRDGLRMSDFGFWISIFES